MKISFVDGADTINGYNVRMVSIFHASAGFFQARWYNDKVGKREHTKIVVVKQKRLFDTLCIFAHEFGHYLIWLFIDKRLNCPAHKVYDGVFGFLMERRWTENDI